MQNFIGLHKPNRDYQNNRGYNLDTFQRLYVKGISTQRINNNRPKYTKVDPRFLMSVLVEKPFSSKNGFRAVSSSDWVAEGRSSSGKMKGISHLSVNSQSMQMKLMSAPWMILARPGTESDTKLRIVRKDMSLIVPHMY